MSRRSLGLMVVALSLAATACSSGNAEELADAIAAEMWDDAQAQAAEGLPTQLYTEDDYRCIASVMIDVIGYQALVDSGVTPESVRSGVLDTDLELLDSVTEEEALRAFDGLAECVDLAAALAAPLAEVFTSASEESVLCLASGLVESDVYRRAVAIELISPGSALSGIESPEVSSLFVRLLDECFTEEEAGPFAPPGGD